MRHRLVAALGLIMLVGCGPASAPIPTATQIAATSTPAATATLEIVTSPTPAALPLLITPPPDEVSLDACALVPQAVAVEAIGGMDSPPEPYFTSGVNDDPPIIFACEFWGEMASASLRVWVADSVERAAEDFAHVKAAAGEQAQMVGGAGDEALWWPQALTLHVRQGNARVWVSFVQAFDGAPVAAHRLASAALIGLMQTAASVPPPTPGPDPAPETLAVTRTVIVEPPDWNTMLPEGICVLLDQEVWSRMFNGIIGAPAYSTSIGEGVGQTFSCSAEGANGGGSFTLIDFDVPAGTYRYYAWFGYDYYARPADPAPLSGVGDTAFWSEEQKLLAAARGNIFLTVSLSGDRATSDSTVTLANSVLNKLDALAGQN